MTIDQESLCGRVRYISSFNTPQPELAPDQDKSNMCRLWVAYNLQAVWFYAVTSKQQFYRPGMSLSFVPITAHQ